MDIEKAVIYLKSFLKEYEDEQGKGDLAEGIAEMIVDWTEEEAIQTVLNELDNKDKLINLILEDIHRRSIDCVISTEELLQEYKEKFKKVEGK